MATAGESHPPTDVEKVVSTTDNESVSPGIVQKLDDKILKHSHDADAAMKAFEGMSGQVIELTPEKSKALLRKIDLHLMPVSGPRRPILHPDIKLTVIDHVYYIWVKLPGQVSYYPRGLKLQS
jgi:ACS family allantoate permease-like MFS transporter